MHGSSSGAGRTRKKIWIAAQSGSLHVNDIETPMSEVYNADTIEIGDAKLRFNRTSDERPLESSQEGDLRRTI